MQLENVKHSKEWESSQNSKNIILPSEPECSLESLKNILNMQGYEITPLNASSKTPKRKILGFNEFGK
jgi:hypothetical protein